MFENLELFDSLSPSEKETLSLFCQERQLGEGEVLFHEGDEANAMYVVKSGMLKAYKDRSDGEKFVGYIPSGETAGEMAVFGREIPEKRMASVRAVEETRLLVIMDYAIRDLGNRYREIYDKISGIIRERQRKNSSTEGR